MSKNKRSFRKWKKCPYEEWLKSGGCSVGEVNEMLMQEHFACDLGELKAKKMGEMFDVPHHGPMIERLCETHYISNDADFTR